jgi:hypothetical protein
MSTHRFLLVSFFLLGVGLFSTDIKAQYAGTIILGRPEDTSIVANVMSPTAGTVFIEYGTQSNNYSSKTPTVTLAANTPLEIPLTSLTSNTRYYYKLSYTATGSKSASLTTEYSFMTQRSPGSTFVFCCQGDSHPERTKNAFDPNLYIRTLSSAAASKPDFFVTLGDDFSVDTLTTYSQSTVWGRYTLQLPYLNILGPNAPIMLTNGNHEQAANYLYDGTPNNVASWAQSGRNTYYSNPAPDNFYTGNPTKLVGVGANQTTDYLRDYFAWTWGDALFVVIDFYWESPVCVDSVLGGGAHVNTDEWLDTLGATQFNWLEQTLKTSNAKFKFVFAHHEMGTGRGGIECAKDYEWGGNDPTAGYIFAQKRPGWSMPIHQMFVTYGVTAFFSGHDHAFVRQQLDGVTYQELPYAADPNYGLYNADAYDSGVIFPAAGYARVTVNPTYVKIDYVRTYLPADEGPGRVNGATVYSYTLTPRPNLGLVNTAKVKTNNSISK